MARHLSVHTVRIAIFAIAALYPRYAAFLRAGDTVILETACVAALMHSPMTAITFCSAASFDCRTSASWHGLYVPRRAFEIIADKEVWARTDAFDNQPGVRGRR
jgi:hypothetical protein